MKSANLECQRAIAPIRDTGSIFDYLKPCRNIRSKIQKMQMLIETMGACFKKENKRCFTCRDKSHLKKTALRKSTTTTTTKPPKICPRCCRKMH